MLDIKVGMTYRVENFGEETGSTIKVIGDSVIGVTRFYEYIVLNGRGPTTNLFARTSAFHEELREVSVSIR